MLLVDYVQDEVLHDVEPDFEAASNVHPSRTAVQKKILRIVSGLKDAKMHLAESQELKVKVGSAN